MSHVTGVRRLVPARLDDAWVEFRTGTWQRIRLPIYLALAMGLVGRYTTAKPVRILEAAAGISLLTVAAVDPAYLLLFSPFYAYVGIQYAPSKVILAVPALAILYVLIGLYSRRYRVYPLLFGLLAVFAVWMIGSYLYGQMLGNTTTVATTILPYLLMGFAYCGAAAAVRINREWLLMSVVALGASASLLARFAQEAVVGAGSVASDVRVRAGGYDPNAVGIMMGWGALAAFGLLLIRRQPAWILAILLCLSGLPATKSRASILVIAVGILVMVMLSQSWRTKWLCVAAGIGVLMFVPNATGQIEHAVLQDRVQHLSAQSDQIRRNLVVNSFKIGARNPVAGLGFGRYNQYAESRPEIGQFQDPHNQYGQFLAESGFPALAMFVLLVVLAYRCRVRGPTDLVLKGLLAGMLMACFTAPELLNLATGIPTFMVIGSLIGTDFDRRHADWSRGDADADVELVADTELAAATTA